MENQENKTPSNKTSALLIIGNEILSGRTLDKNTQYIGEAMGGPGVPLSEVRVVPDIEARIIGVLDQMREDFDFVFTTGGIGPTHDDITAATVAKAFGAEFGRHAEAHAILLKYYGAEELTDARASMADMPIYEDMELILNPVSAAPGFRIGNVFVMAGVPKIMQGMLDHVVEMITPGAPMLSRTVMLESPESAVAEALGRVQAAHPSIDIGSYPQFKKGGGWGVSIVLRGLEDAPLDLAKKSLVEAMQEQGVPVKEM